MFVSAEGVRRTSFISVLRGCVCSAAHIPVTELTSSKVLGGHGLHFQGWVFRSIALGLVAWGNRTDLLSVE